MGQTEKTKILNGKWKFITDRDNKLTYEKTMQLLEKQKAKEMHIPVNWELAGLHNFSGSIWFAKKFSLNEKRSKISILEFKGVDYFADVWLNNNYLGNHEGYFQPFQFDVSEVIKSRNNFLVVKVNSPFEEPKKVWPLKKKLIKGIFNHHDCRPGGWSYEHGQDKNTGGIWNDVLLHFANYVYLQSVNVSSKIYFEENNALVKISLSFYMKNESLLKDNIEILVTSPSAKNIKRKFSVHFDKVECKKDFIVEIKSPELWWSWDLGKPSLYNLKISGKLFKSVNIKFGIREVKLNLKSEFYLNRKRLFLRGTNVIPAQFLSELNTIKIKEQVTLIRQANINIIRMHAHVNRKEYYDECDSQGIIIWQDFALQWTYDESNEFISNSVSQIKDMIRLLYNHPSIAFWCCHNEPGKQIETLDTFLYDAVISIDNTRVIRKASNYEEHPYDGWYWGNKEHFAARPMGPLVTEFGAQALPELHSLEKFIPQKEINKPESAIWAYHNFQYDHTFNVAQVNRGKNIKEFINNSQEYQAELIQTAADFFRRGKNTDITGIFQFMFIDCWPSITWSVVDYYMKKKAGYSALQKVFQSIYVSVNVLQKKYFAGSRLNIEFWIINDLHKSFKNSIVVFKIKNKSIARIKTGDIKEDSIIKFPREDLTIKLPKNIRTGWYNVIVELKNKNQIVSSNDFRVEVVNK